MVRADCRSNESGAERGLARQQFVKDGRASLANVAPLAARTSPRNWDGRFFPIDAARPDEACFVSERRCLRAVPEAKLRQDALHVGLHGSLADDERLRDLGIRIATGDERQHLLLPRRQRLDSGWQLACRQLLNGRSRCPSRILGPPSGPVDGPSTTGTCGTFFAREPSINRAHSACRAEAASITCALTKKSRTPNGMSASPCQGESNWRHRSDLAARYDDNRCADEQATPA